MCLRGCLWRYVSSLAESTSGYGRWAPHGLQYAGALEAIDELSVAPSEFWNNRRVSVNNPHHWKYLFSSCDLPIERQHSKLWYTSISRTGRLPKKCRTYRESELTECYFSRRAGSVARKSSGLSKIRAIGVRVIEVYLSFNMNEIHQIPVIWLHVVVNWPHSHELSVSQQIIVITYESVAICCSLLFIRCWLGTFYRRRRTSAWRGQWG